ncbi:hypothetical protein BP6252_05541 [Coleophoma cylindrospora]|uniref:Uncharacterized protein n=1 Tax=Coleophoma cylindrospora TaxID=1849047 RepID=A0A3D8RU53_9HELO|nr:hypothetical protein BP6252_05541 [Coleophoma cylindrospora]
MDPISAPELVADASSVEEKRPYDEKKPSVDIEVNDLSDDPYDDAAKIYVPDEHEEFIDPRLKDYPVPLVAKTVDLHNDFSEPILTFRFWFLSTFWLVVGCGISSFYYFKPYQISLSSYAVQLLSWGMGSAMSTYLPTRVFNTFGYKWSLNPGKWNAKEHALIVVAYWGSGCVITTYANTVDSVTYGLGPLSALELYYGKRMNAGWGILFLITTQSIGYGLAGLFRDILVRPPQIYYPGVLPNVSLFNAMHRNPTVTAKSLKFFTYVACATFVYQWFPGFIFPMLSSLPLLCYMGHGNWIAYILGSGYSGFGLLDVTLDWNYTGFFQPLYTPLWANMHQIIGAVMTVWFLYPIMYFTNTLNAKNFPPMSSGTFDSNGTTYNITRIMNPDFTLNQAAMDAYSAPHWSLSYAMYFFWGFAASTGALMYAILWYGKSSYRSTVDAFKNIHNDYDDPYLKLMSRCERVPHWWYGLLLAICVALSIGMLYGGDMQLPWWGFIIILIISTISTFPNGILWGIANFQVGMGFLSEVIAGALFPGKPVAVLACMTFGRQILEQNLNLISDYKFGFLYGTLLGPFINYGMMRVIIDNIGKDVLTGAVTSSAWDALKTKNYYSLSVLWGVIGPKVFFSSSSSYAWIYYAFAVGPVIVTISWLINKWKPHWNMEHYCNPVVIMYGATLFPVYQTANIMTSAAFSIFFMGYVYRYHPIWFRKYNYLLGVGLDCGTQIMQTFLVFCINLPNQSMPYWWGYNAQAYDRCFPPETLPPNALN